MTGASRKPQERAAAGHARWIRVSHWLLAAAVITLAFSGFVILMAHPRLYWGQVGNDLTPALFELPISRNYRHEGWAEAIAFYPHEGSVITAVRTYDIFNQNGWARSLHFLAAWVLAVAGFIYLLPGILGGHFTRDLIPRFRELKPRLLWQDIVGHLRFPMPAAAGGPPYGLLQRLAYVGVVFVALPLAVVSGLAMAPAVAAAFPWLLDLFGGSQSARTIHFFTFAVLLLFLVIHVLMVALTGFRRQMRAMTLGD
jgi:thiosulfate reductase cytochrome b subunit